MPDPKRMLKVLTRDSGVRNENPLMTVGDNSYYPYSKVRTPALRKEADEVLTKEDPETAKKYKIAAKALK